MTSESDKKKKRGHDDGSVIEEDRRTLRLVEIVIVIVALIIGARYLVSFFEPEVAAIFAPDADPVVVVEPTRTPRPQPTATRAPTTADDWITLGRERYDADDYTGALTAFDEGIALAIAEGERPEDGYYWRGLTRYLLGEYNTAIADLTRAIEFGYQPLNPPLYFRGRSYYEQANYVQAIENFTDSIEVCETSCHLDWYYRGRALLATDSPQAAINDFERAIDVDPDYLPPYRSRIEAYRELDDADGVLRAQADLLVVQASEVIPLSLGDGTVNAELDNPDMQLTIPFDASAGQTASITITAVNRVQTGGALSLPSADNLEPVALVTDPDGNPLVYVEGERGVVEIPALDLPADGAYTLRVGSVDADSRGQLQVKVTLR